MRKILAGFLAAAMVASLGATMSFAATTYTSASIVATIADPSHDVKAISTSPTDPDGDNDDIAAGTDNWHAVLSVEEATVILADGSTFTIPINATSKITKASGVTLQSGGGVAEYADMSISDVEVGGAVKGKSFKFDNAIIAGSHYTGTISFGAADGKAITIKFDQTGKIPSAALASAPTVTLKAVMSNPTTDAVIEYDSGDPDATPNITLDSTTTSFAVTTSPSVITDGTGTETMDNDKNGIFDAGKILVRDVVRSYGDGTPIPLTEDKRGVDEALNEEGGVQSGKTLYFMIRDDEDCPVQRLNDDTYWKLKISKGDNGKYIKNISDVTKIFNKDLYNANTGAPEPNTGADKKRHRYIKVELNEIYTDDEYKLTLDMRLSATSAAVRAGIATDNSDIKIKDFSFWMKNLVKDADNDWKVGIGGLMLNPLENDWNEVTYFDEDGDLAFMKFFADSDVSKFYAKLSTKWEHADYASYFNDQDAYIFDFVGSPKISATSRCDLQIYNPFVNDNGDETIDPSTAVIYQVIDGDLFDVTDSFKYEEGENGEMAYTTRTRFLGTYIICEKAVEEAMDNNDTPEELTPDTNVTPDEVTPDNNGGGKAPANTGKYF